MSYVFTSFISRNIAYTRIKMVWRAYIRVNNIKLNEDKNSTGVSRQILSDSDSNSSEEESEINLNQIPKSTNLSELNTSIEDLDSSNKEEIYFPPVDPEKVFECCKIEINSTSNELFEKFVKNNADSGWEKFYDEALGNTNVSITEWKEIEPNILIRDLNFVVKVKDVPFINQTRVHKAQKLKKEGDKFSIVGSSTSLDAPYSSYFHIEDTWEFIPNNDKCVLRTTACVVFTKSTFFKSKIESKTKETFKQEVDKWCDYITSKGITYDNYYVPKKKISKDDEVLTHGVEKSHKILDNMSPVFNYTNEIKDKIFNFYYSNPRDFFIILCFSILFLLILVIMKKLENQNELFRLQIRELNDVKNFLMNTTQNLNINTISTYNLFDNIKTDL